MRIVIEVSPALYERAQHVLSDNRYTSLAQLARVALENQLLLESEVSLPGEAQAAGVVGSVGSPNKPSSGQSKNEGFALLAMHSIPNGTPIPTLERNEAANRDVGGSGWLWGIVNRVFPIKLAARSLLMGGEINSGVLQQTSGLAAQRAQAAAVWLTQLYGTAAPPREESLLTGLPLREPLYKARQRFADSYFGRFDKKGHAWGALFELGLAGTDARGRVRYASLTDEGVAFATLRNPVLDDGDITNPLSEAEIDFYTTKVATTVPRERHCFRVLLGALAERDRTVDELSRVAAQSLPRTLSPAAIQTMKSGALGRLQDLRLITRAKNGRTASFALTQRGQEALATLGQAEEVPSINRSR